MTEGTGWDDRMSTGELPRRDAWMSVFVQLLPGINWGLVAVVLTPKALQKYCHDLYYKILPLLGVNRNIGKEWRTIPERYQGLGLPDFEVHVLSEKVHFLQQQWDGNDSTFKITGATYKSCGDVWQHILQILGGVQDHCHQTHMVL